MEKSAFEKYKDEVKYDYILEGTAEYTLEGAQDEDQEIDAMEELEAGIQDLLNDEDYLKDVFPEIGVGRVYPELAAFDDVITIKFGISIKEQSEDFTVEDLKSDVVEFMYNLNSNVEGVRVSGIYAPGFDDETGAPDDYETEPTTVYISQIERNDIKVTVLEQPTKTESLDLDKKLVNDGKLSFTKEDKCSDCILNEEGIVEVFEESRMTNSFTFSKSKVNEYCSNLIKEGYSLVEAQDFDIEAEKEQLQNDIKSVDEIQQLKDELDKKIDNLNENIDVITIEEFPSTEQTAKTLSYDDIKDINVNTLLNSDQEMYIQQLLGDNTFDTVFKQLWDVYGFVAEEPIISIDDYVMWLKNN